MFLVYKVGLKVGIRCHSKLWYNLVLKFKN